MSKDTFTYRVVEHMHKRDHHHLDNIEHINHITAVRKFHNMRYSARQAMLTQFESALLDAMGWTTQDCDKKFLVSLVENWEETETNDPALEDYDAWVCTISYGVV